MQESQAWADSLLSKMTLEEKIGQLYMMAAYSNKDEKHEREVLKWIQEKHIGGLIFFQGGPGRQLQLTNTFQKASKIPLMIAMDAEWGLSMRIDSVMKMPWMLTLGATGNAALVEQVGEAIALQCKRLGVHINFGPVADINTNPKNPIINARSFGENRDKVFQYSWAYARGMQKHGVMACAKHFPGHGDTDEDSHLTLPVIKKDLKTLEEGELYPFKLLADSGVASFMIGHLNVPALDKSGVPSSLSPLIIKDLLQKSWQYQGLIFTDALNMKGINQNAKPGETELAALLAGVDVLLMPNNIEEGIAYLVKCVADGKLPLELIDAKVLKILNAKHWMGLKNQKTLDKKNLFQDLNKPSFQVLKQKAMQEAVTLLINRHKSLPFRDLANTRYALITTGEEVSTEFADLLRNYAQVEVFENKKGQETSLMNELQYFDEVIFSIFTSDRNPWKKYHQSPEVKNFVKMLSLQNNFTAVLFANPYAVIDFTELELASSVVVAYQNNTEAHRAVAHVLFGAAGAQGEIPVTVSSFFLQGLGLKTQSINRLSYGLPSEVGLNASTLDKIDKLAIEGIQSGAYPGCQILVARHGKVIYQRSFGTHTYESTHKVHNHDLYDIASVTKIAASVPALMYLTDMGKFSLDAQLGDYLPSTRGSNKESLIIRDMLAHQAGLKAWIPFFTETVKSGKPDTLIYKKTKSFSHPQLVAHDLYISTQWRDTIVKRINQSALSNDRKYLYSDLGYYYYREIIERQTAKKFQDLLQDEFYSPLGAYTLTFNPLEKFPKEKIAPTELDKTYRNQLIHGTVHDQGAAMLGGIAGHAGLFSNANDLAKLMQMYLNYGQYGGKRFIDSLTIAEFTRCQFCEDNNNRRGAGFDKRALTGNGPTCGCDSPLSFGHSGFTGTLAWADPESGIVYIFLSNRVYPDAENQKLLKSGIRTRIQQLVYDAIEN